MSTIFSLLLLLALLGFSLSACNARAALQTKGSDGELNPVARVSTPLMPDDANVEKDHDSKVESGSNGDDRDLDEEKRSGGLGSESVASVQWRVPHRKKGETEPGFNLDYLPPKTHPPVHN